MKPAYLSALLATLLCRHVTFAQFSAEATVTNIVDNNINNNFLQISDRVTEAALSTGYDWEAERSNTWLFYSGSLKYFSANFERTYHTHTVGATYSHTFDEDDETSLSTGGTYSMQLGRGNFTLSDNTQLSLHAGLRHSFTERLAGRANYSFRTARFPEFEEFDYVEHYVFVQSTAFLPTRTTLILQADIGTKIYSTPTDDLAQGPSMPGKGKRGPQHNSASAASATQLSGLARIGQPITEGTGLRLTGSYQVNVQNGSRYLSAEQEAISRDELFDDHYGYEGLHTSLMLTQLLPADAQMKIEGSLQNRNYSDRRTGDASGNPEGTTREDRRAVLSFLVENRFATAGISLGVSYDYIVNHSNDGFYEYTNSVLTAHLSFGY